MSDLPKFKDADEYVEYCLAHPWPRPKGQYVDTWICPACAAMVLADDTAKRIHLVFHWPLIHEAQVALELEALANKIIGGGSDH